VRNPAAVEELIAYLEKRRTYIPDYQQRQRAGLWIASTRVEKYNDWAVSARCKHQGMRGAIPKCGHVALVLDCCYVDICVIFSSSGSLRMRLISQFSRASGARFSETDDSPETVVGRWILPAKLKALLGSSTLVSQVVPGKDIMAESKLPLFGIAPLIRRPGNLSTPRPMSRSGRSKRG